MTNQSGHRSRVSDRLSAFGTTIFAEMTRLANEHNAINLSQGFPDFDGPAFIKNAAADAINAGHNQYARSAGEPELVRAIAQSWHHDTGVSIDPMAQVTVTAGCTEALIATHLGLVNPGDEVILFEPYYDSYRACVAIAGGTPRFVALRPGPDGSFAFDPDELRGAFSSRTRAIVVNTPHNPTGKVFTRAELDQIARLCIEFDCVAISDEVYERIVFEPALPHISIATIPGMADRTITLSSLGKTYSLTGWKIGWAIACEGLTACVRAAHQFLTFAVATPLQHAAAIALRDGNDAVHAQTEQYHAARDFLCDALADIGFGVTRPAGTYFIMADHSGFGLGDDVAFCTHLAAQIGVAAIPPSVFYNRPELGQHLVRFAFCKRRATLERAVERLARLGG